MISYASGDTGWKPRSSSIRTPMNAEIAAFLVYAVLLLGVGSSRGQQLLLSDDFNSGSTSAAGFNSTLVADQAGLVAPINYTVTTGGNDWDAQHGNGGAMLLVGNSGYGATASLNYNFATLANLANSPLQIKFDGYVDSTTNAGCWLSFAIGNAQNILGYTAQANFGLLPTWDGNLAVWADGSQIQGATHSGNTYSVVLANRAGTGSAFNGNGSMAMVYNETNLVNTYALSQLGTADGYISFGANPWNGSWNLTHIDNLSVSNLTGTIADVFLTWNGFTSQNWNTTDFNWTGGGAVWNNSLFGDAIFGSSGVGTVNLTTNITARSVTFNTAGYTLTNGSLALTGPQSVTNNANATIATPIISGALNKFGSGALTLSGLNTFTGGTTVTAGTLQLAAYGGNCPVVGTLTVNPGATVTTAGDGTGFGTNGGQQVTSLNINGGMVNATGTMYLWNLTNGGVTLTGGILQGYPLQWGDTVVNSSASSTPSVIGGQINLRADDNSANASLLLLNVADGGARPDLLVSAAITESGFPANAKTGGHCCLVKTGLGTLRVSGSVQISGVISVEAGTLDFAPSGLNTNARIWVASGARLLLSVAGTNTVTGFYIDGSKQSAGRWGAPGSVATGLADFETPIISGSGVLLVTDSGVANRDRWKRMKYGQFTTYDYFGILPDGTSYNNTDFAADNFNVPQFASNLQSMGVEYELFTAWHDNFIPLFNSAAVVRSLGFQRNSTRDLLGDLLAAVRPTGIRVLFYTHPNQPVIYNYAGHNNMINDVYGELIDRYGDQIDGLYLDENDPSGNQDSAVDYPRLERTIHRRNPDLILIQNFYGNLYSCDVPSAEWASTAANYSTNVGYASVGHIAEVCSTGGWEAAIPTNTYAAARSSQGIFRAAVMAAGSCTEGGGVAWAAGPFAGGLWEQGVLAMMQGAGQLLAPVAVAVTNTYPSTSWPTFGGVFIGSLPYGIVATRSLDGTEEYIHVLNPPSGNTLRLPPAADGKVFANARLLVNSNALTLAQSPRGVQLKLTGTNTWATNDTVIALDVVTKGDQGIYNNTSPAITYGGNSWSYQDNRNLGEFRNDVEVATDNGDSFTLNFSGTDVSFISSRGPSRGVVALYLDGVLQTNLDLSLGTTNRDAVFALAGLADGAHTLTGVKTSGTYLYVDAFKVSEMLNDNNIALTYGNLTRFNNTDSTSNSVGYIAYTGTWSWQARTGGEYDGDITWSQTLGDYFTINFIGTGVRMIGDGLGMISFYLDGTFIQTVNMNAGGNVVGVVGFATNGLALGSHQLKGVVAGGPYVQVDEFDVYNPVYSGWSYQPNRNLGDFLNDIHDTANTYDTFNLNFTGTGIDVIAPVSSAGGTVQVTLDGGVVENVNQYAGGVHPQATNFSSYNAATLAAGNHQLQLLKPRSFGSLAVDAVRIYKGVLDSAAPLQWGSSGGGGSGTWDANTSPNWFDGANASLWLDIGGTDYAGVFAGSAGTVNLAGGINANHLTFNAAGYTLQGNPLNLNGMNPTISTASNVTTTVGSLINSSGGLTKSGAGTLTLAAANTFTGNTTINGGTLAISVTGKLYGGGYTTLPTVTVSSGTTLQVSGWFYDAAGDLGDLDFSRDRLVVNGGTIEFVGGSNGTDPVGSGRNFVVGTGGATLKASAAGQAWTLGNNTAYGALINSNGLTLDGIGNGVICKMISGPGGLTKIGSGTWTLTNNNAYTGNTTVNNGTLVISQPTLAASSIISVGAGAGLQLAFAPTNAVKGLILHGVGQPAGIYAAANAAPYLSGPGSLRVGLGLNPINLAASLAGTNLTLSWPADHVGWTLQMQTNHLSLGVSGNLNDWMRLPASVTTNQVIVNTAGVAGFYRLTYP